MVVKHGFGIFCWRRNLDSWELDSANRLLEEWNSLCFGNFQRKFWSTLFFAIFWSPLEVIVCPILKSRRPLK
ncbi:hypothetical protein MANES_16G067951v8 [Manihot esculenta]|uniref:Uncharacterized protein n=1 Tax=Manihot esculenta TaxID=3983 RepID=A0ACB7G6I4_MANES|nr:hypothetical protein MANES_16G067951v8 [Manihot esculenta]